MIPVFERAKTVHALGRAATVIGDNEKYKLKNFRTSKCITRKNYKEKSKAL
jgi:hypothetical protein